MFPIEVIKIKRSISYGAKFYVVGKSGEKWRVEKMRARSWYQLLAPSCQHFCRFSPPNLAILCRSLNINLLKIVALWGLRKGKKDKKSKYLLSSLNFSSKKLQKILVMIHLNVI